MSEKGIPVRLTTDGGPQFTSRAFKEFCASWEICHTISSQGHQSPSRKDDSEWERECRRLPHRPPGVQEHPARSRAQPIRAAVWAQSSVESVVTPQRISAAMARAAACSEPGSHNARSQSQGTTQPAGQVPVGSPTRHRRPGATPAKSVGTRSQKWWSARLAGAAMVSRQRAVACSGATAASCASSFPQPLRRETGPCSFALYYYYSYFRFLSSLATINDLSFSGRSPCCFLSVTVCSTVTDSGGGHVLVSPATLTIMAAAAPSGRAL